MNMKLRSLDLFSGVGGITLALEGFAEPVAYCDIAPEARAVLLDRMARGLLPRAPIADDVRTLDRAWLRRSAGRAAVDAIVAGFPCVGFSSLGLRQGLADSQSGLFSEVLRLADEFAPPVLFLENVRGILKLGMDAIADELHGRRGYELRWCVVSAADVGAQHVRPRWFCLAVKPGFRWSCPASQQGRVRPADHVGAAPLTWWAQHRPPARALALARAPTSPASAAAVHLRLGLMGNSVVPQAVRCACAYLLSRGTVTPAPGVPVWPSLIPAAPGLAGTRRLPVDMTRPVVKWPSRGVLPVSVDLPLSKLPAPPSRAPGPGPRTLDLVFDPATYRAPKPPSPLLRPDGMLDRHATPRHDQGLQLPDPALGTRPPDAGAV
jgi:DNA (cytosine-5)-methyltransferase 1